MLWTSDGAIEVASEQLLKKVDRTVMSRSPELIPPVWMGESRVAEIRMLQQDQTNLTWSADRAIVSWEVKTGQRAGTALATDALCLAAAADGTRLAEGGADMRVRIRDAATLEVLQTLRVHDGPVLDMAWHPKLPLLATASSDYSIRIWDLRTEQMREEFRYIRNIQPMRVKWSPDGKYLAVSDSGGAPNVNVYEPEACKETDRAKR
jgi:WD40 repeat protein